MLISAANILVALRNLAFPPACAACGARLESQGHFCSACSEQVSLCLKRETDSAALALGEYGGPLGQALRGFKYNRRLAAGAVLAKWLARQVPEDWLAGIDLIAPVPLHRRRLISRGFNQAVLLFAPLAQKHGIHLAPRLLARVRDTKPQVDLSPKERLSNVAGAFGASYPRQIDGRRVLVVDDVYTTGATVNECSQVLRQAGAARVRILTLAKTVSQHNSPS